MRPWAKLWSATSEDLKVAELIAESPLAEALRCHSLARASCHGILPGEPALFKARVAPAADIRMAEIATCIDLLVERGFYHRFERGGHLYIYVIHYGDWQDVEWLKTGKPEFPLPPEWVWPAALIHLAAAKPEAFARVADQLTRSGASEPELFGCGDDGRLPVDDQSPSSPGLVALESRRRVEEENDSPPYPPPGEWRERNGSFADPLASAVDGSTVAYAHPLLNTLAGPNSVVCHGWPVRNVRSLRKAIADHAGIETHRLRVGAANPDEYITTIVQELAVAPPGIDCDIGKYLSSVEFSVRDAARASPPPGNGDAQSKGTIRELRVPR